MNAAARPYVKIVFYCLAILAGIFAFIFFMRMNEEWSANDKFKTHGVVSRAVVTDKNVSASVITSNRGRSRTVEYNFIHIRHFPKSEVKFADFRKTVQEADLPVAPPVTGDPMKDMDNAGILDVPMDIYEKISVGDMLTVVNTPWDSSSPTLVSDVDAFDPSVFHLNIYISLAFTVLFGAIGWWIRKTP